MKTTIPIVLVCVGAALSTVMQPQTFAGKRKNQKIFVREEAPPHSIPYQVAIYASGYFCTGSLIDLGWVLTSASCGELTGRPKIVLGAHNLQENEPMQVVFEGRQPIIHAGWDSSTLENDIALIQLPQDAPLSDYIGIVELDCDQNEHHYEKSARVSGWKFRLDPGLQQCFSTVKDCDSMFIYLEEEDLCSCANVGVPVAEVESGKLIGMGAYGFVIGCEERYLAGFTRISSYCSWIVKNIANPYKDLS